LEEVALVMPMAGRGSRFADDGVLLPKPLVSLWGRSFFWWATESARRAFDVVETVFVLLRDHVQDFAIDQQIRALYPDARFVVTPEVTSGAAETAKLGVEQLTHRGPLIVNDTDHAFVVGHGRELVSGLRNGTAAALLSFQSDNPAYSYASIGEAGEVTGTVEKKVVSPYAIAGGYLFASPAEYLTAYVGYGEECPYDEAFISGLYDRLIRSERHVALQVLDDHLSFGTPEELRRLGDVPPQPWAAWL
jgi:NDP-sugar pyrophosphorylase family protein